MGATPYPKGTGPRCFMPLSAWPVSSVDQISTPLMTGFSLSIPRTTVRRNVGVEMAGPRAPKTSNSFPEQETPKLEIVLLC